MKIRRATKKDLIQITELGKEMILFEGKIDKIEHTLDKKTAVKGIKKYYSFHLKSKKSFIWVAEENGKLIGYLFAKEKKRPDVFTAKECVEIEDVFVKEKFRNKKIGEKLMAEAINHFKKRGQKIIKLIVLFKNKKAIDFYKRLGFKENLVEMRKIV